MSATRDAARKRPHRRKAPPAPSAEPRKMELIGLTEDGRKVLWDVGNVQPVSAFETSPRDKQLIQSGHYVIHWKGCAITVHCGNEMWGSRWMIGVLFMCSNGPAIPMRRAEVEAILIGKVIPDPEVAARITELLREIRGHLAKLNDAPERQRGKLA